MAVAAGPGMDAQHAALNSEPALSGANSTRVASEIRTSVRRNMIERSTLIAMRYRTHQAPSRRHRRTARVTAVHLLIDTAMRRGVLMEATCITWPFNDFSVTYVRSVHHA
jgi:hypothetical protein